MRLLSLKLFLFFIYLLFISNTSADQKPDIKNLKIHKDPKQVSNIVFKDYRGLAVSLEDFRDSLVLINFWATWCAPCKKEMPSLSELSRKLPNLKVYAINMEKPNIKKVQNFYNDLKINNIKIYFDPEFNLAKKFRMRGLPTTIFIDKSGNEFARAIGEIDFNSKKLIELLEKKINL